MTEIITSRRSFITGLITLVAAPAIVRVSSIMPVKVMEPVPVPLPPGDYRGYVEMLEYSEGDARLVWKLYNHARNYGVSQAKFDSVFFEQRIHLKDSDKLV